MCGLSNLFLITVSLTLLVKHGNSITREFPDNRGREFILVFQDNFPDTYDIELFMTTGDGHDVDVTVSVPLNASITPSKRVIKSGRMSKITFPSHLRLKGTSIQPKGIHIEASDEIIVYGANKGSMSTDAFMCLPTDVLGTEYYVPSWPKKDKYTGPQIGVAGVYDNTKVNFTFPNNNANISVFFGGQRYENGDTLAVTLNRFQAFQVQCEGDLTGTRVTSSRPVGVTSGNKRTRVGKGSSSDHLVEMIPPVNTWGRRFVTVPLKERQTGDYFRILASRDGTSIHIRGTHNTTKVEYVRDAGQFLELDVPSNEHLYIETDKAVLVNQYCKTSFGHALSDPFLIYIPPTEQYAADYTFATIESTYVRYNHYVSLVIRTRDIKGLRCDGRPLKVDDLVHPEWEIIPRTEFSANAMKISAGTHSLYHTSPIVTFAAFSYGLTQQESYGYVAGTRLASIGEACIVKKTPPYADGQDNDCDSKIDEEIANGIDDDGDGLIDEDLATDDETATSIAPITGSPRTIKIQKNEHPHTDLSKNKMNGVLFQKKDAEAEAQKNELIMSTALPAVGFVAIMSSAVIVGAILKKRARNRVRADEQGLQEDDGNTAERNKNIVLHK